MRLSQEEIKILKHKLFSISKNAKIFLFGSRIDDMKKGGDIDILILDDTLSLKDLRSLRIEFFKKFGEQKLDIVLDKMNPVNPFTKHILNKAIQL